MALTRLSQLTGWLPILAIHLTYLLSALGGYVDWCFPYFDSCTSISATGRHGVAFYVFKGTMIPQATLLALYWLVTERWLASLGDQTRWPRVILVLGVLGAVFLVVYAVALGAAGDTLRLQRRIGIVIYFGFTALCQLLLVWRLRHLPLRHRSVPVLYGLCWLMLAIGIGTVLLQVILGDAYEKIENAFEWVLALVMQVSFLVTTGAWRASGLRLELKSGPN